MCVEKTRQFFFYVSRIASDAQVNTDRMYQMVRLQELMYLFVTAGVSGFLPIFGRVKTLFNSRRILAVGFKWNRT